MEAHDNPGVDRQTRQRGTQFWVIVIVGSLIAIGGTSFVGYVLRLPRFLIVWADVMLVVFLAMPIVTGKVGEADVLTPRRAKAFFGVIPAIGVVAGLLMVALGVGVQVGLYAFSAVIVLCNFIYWVWFDRPASSDGGGSPGSSVEHR